MTLTDLIALAIRENPGPSPQVARGVKFALEKAGYRILAPGELDAETLEKAAQVADQYSTNPLVAAKGWDDEQRDYHETGQLDASLAIAAAIRSLKGGSE